MTKKQKKIFKRIIVSLIFLIVAYVVNFLLNKFTPLSEYETISELVKAFLFVIPYMIIGYDVVFGALKNLRYGRLFDEKFLMALATIGAFGTGEYPEAAFVMLFYQIGELFQGYAVGKSRKSIAALMNIRPDVANVLRNGETISVDPSEVNIGETIVIKPGERIPLDGVVTEGETFIDTTAMTGESVPRKAVSGDDVISGCINVAGVINVRVTKSFSESTVSKILELVENTSNRKAKAEQFITKFARYYTPVVVISAVVLAFLPPLILFTNPLPWIKRALIFLVISCPCALVISVPLSFFCGIGSASKSGILIKGANYMEVLAKTKTIVFDKTGTLTKGVFNVTAIHPNEYSQDDLLTYAAYAENYSTHPIADSIKAAYAREIDTKRLSDVKEIAGKGISCKLDGMEVYVGNNKLMDDLGVKWHPCHHEGTTVHVSVNSEYAGHIVISDEIKEDTIDGLKALKEAGIKKTVMLTGDSLAIGEAVGKSLKIDKVYAELLPNEKVDKMEEIIKASKNGEKVAYVGDGINDAPVLSISDIGFAMGAMGSDSAIEAADVVLMDDRISKIATAVKISVKTFRIVYENIIFSLAVKFAILILGVFGLANMWMAIFADVGVLILAVLNAMRCFKTIE